MPREELVGLPRLLGTGKSQAITIFLELEATNTMTAGRRCYTRRRLSSWLCKYRDRLSDRYLLFPCDEVVATYPTKQHASLQHLHVAAYLSR